jgi:phenylalanyl-tRNA synthetase alpha chain
MAKFIKDGVEYVSADENLENEAPKFNIMNNIPSSINDKIGTCLYTKENHPIKIIRDKIFSYFKDFTHLNIYDPVVPIYDNFDALLIPKEHVSRKPTDTYYVDADHVLRTHMTAHLVSSVKKGYDRYITCGDVYRKDAIDKTHYPVFHQVDGFCLVPDSVSVEDHLRNTLSGFIKYLFGNDCEFKFLEDHSNKDVYFPFTYNSLEVEVPLKDEAGTIKQIEVLGAGTVQPEIMKEIGHPNRKAWAFGMGIERLAMLFFQIPDIRLFWSNDERFLKQFKDGQITKFVPFSKYPNCYKDITFWLSDQFNYNDMCNIVRQEAKDDIIESVELIDEYANKEGKVSRCYRITYAHPSRTLTNEEINAVQERIRANVVNELKIKLR